MALQLCTTSNEWATEGKEQQSGDGKKLRESGNEDEG